MLSWSLFISQAGISVRKETPHRNDLNLLSSQPIHLSSIWNIFLKKIKIKQGFWKKNCHLINFHSVLNLLKAFRKQKFVFCTANRDLFLKISFSAMKGPNFAGNGWLQVARPNFQVWKIIYDTQIMQVKIFYSKLQPFSFPLWCKPFIFDQVVKSLFLLQLAADWKPTNKIRALANNPQNKYCYFKEPRLQQKSRLPRFFRCHVWLVLLILVQVWFLSVCGTWCLAK